MNKICRPYPENAGYKPIGYVPPCTVCGSSDCWDAYLAWEKKAGIKRDPGPLGVEEDFYLPVSGRKKP